MGKWAYSAFGDEEPTTAAKRFTGPNTTPTTGTTTATPVTFNLRFPGQYADSESGLFYNYFRSYNPSKGRYTQSDPDGLDGGWNSFGYAELNPLLFTDPFGLTSDGHHWVIGPIRRDPNLSSPAREVFERSKTGPIPGGHNFGEGHSGYNKGVKELWDKHLLDNRIDPSKMTGKQAEDFVSKVKGCDDPRVRNFNLRIYNKFIKDGFRRMPAVRSPE